MNLRITHVVTTDAFAGTERYVADLASAQAASGHEVIVIGGEPTMMKRHIGAAQHIAYTGNRTLFQALASQRPDVAHAHLTMAEFMISTTYFASRQVAVVSTRHIASRRGSSPGGRVASHVIKARLDAQIAPSYFVAERCGGRTSVVPTGVPHRPMGSHDRPVVLVAQRLEREKATGTAIRAWAASRLAEVGWEMHIAGRGGEEAELRRLCHDLGVVDSCRFLGHVDDLDRHMAESSILLATATAEPFGLSVLEAMSCGTAVVASAGGGHIETVGKSDQRYLFKTSDHLGAARAMRSLAADPNERQAYGVALRALQQSQFSIASFAEGVHRVYQQVLVKRGR